MVKDKNIRITITIDKKTNEKLDFIVRNSNKTKSQIIQDLIKQKTSISKLWKDIEYNELSNEDKIYYVKSIIENKYLENTTNRTLTELCFDCLSILENLLYKDIDDTRKDRTPKYKLHDWSISESILQDFISKA